MSTQQTKWKKPTDIMRIHRIKRRSSMSKQAERSNDTSKSADDTSLNLEPNNRKRRNPFNCNSPSKRSSVPSVDKENSPVSPTCDDEDIVLSDSEPDTTPKLKLFAVLNTAEQRLLGKHVSDVGDLKVLCERNGPDSQRTSPISPQGPSASTGRNSLQATSALPQNELAVETCGRVPVDWSVKVKMRIVTHSSVDTSSHTVSASEATAHVNFVHNKPLDAVEGVMAALQRCCSYWLHPNLPWFPHFPRIVPDSKIRKQVPGDVGQNDMIQKALYHDWMASFTSVFQQLKMGLCPYFYLCCHHFTVLFRAAGVGGHSNLTACLTPTTRGIREALKRDGIEFSMPNLRTSGQDKSSESENCQSDSQSQADLMPSFSQSSPSQQGSTEYDQTNHEREQNVSEETEEEDLTSTNEGASLWLEDMGLDKKSFPTLEPKKVKIQREGYQQVDRRAESLVFCQGCEVQALFNFLINCRSCTAMTGPQAGIPPTILSPMSFVGATVKNNKIRHSVAKMSLDGETQDAHVLEITGPLLPHHQLNIATIVHEAIPDTVVISYNTHEPTVPFNMDTLLQQEANSGLGAVSSGCRVWENGLHKSVREQLTGHSTLERGSALREVKCHQDGFTWIC